MRFLLLLALAFSLTPPAQQNAQERSRQAGDSQAGKNSISPQSSAPTKAITQPHQTEPTDLHWYSEVKVTDVLIAAFTLGLVIVGFFQWRALNDTVVEAGKASARQSADMQSSIAVARGAADAARETVESYKRSERAWVSYSSFDTHGADGKDIQTGKPMSGMLFTMMWRNFGKTPAINCHLMSAHRVLHPPYDATIPFFEREPKMDSRRATLLPGIPHSAGDRFLDRADVEKLVAHKCKMFLYGRMEYELVYGDSEPRLTEVCVEVDFFGYNSQNNAPVFNFSPIGPQNTAT